MEGRGQERRGEGRGQERGGCKITLKTGNKQEHTSVTERESLSQDCTLMSIWSLGCLYLFVSIAYEGPR